MELFRFFASSCQRCDTGFIIVHVRAHLDREARRQRTAAVMVS